MTYARRVTGLKDVAEFGDYNFTEMPICLVMQFLKSMLNFMCADIVKLTCTHMQDLFFQASSDRNESTTGE